MHVSTGAFQGEFSNLMHVPTLSCRGESGNITLSKKHSLEIMKLPHVVYSKGEHKPRLMDCDLLQSSVHTGDVTGMVFLHSSYLIITL